MVDWTRRRWGGAVVILGATVLLLCTLLSACGRRKAADAGVLRIGMMDIPETLDPHQRNAFGSSNIVGQMYESLVAYDRNLGMVPGLAESWENPEENRWRFHLRRNVRFHTGKILDAYDVKATFTRLQTDKTLENGSYISHVTDVRVLDPYMIEVTTSRLSISTLSRLLYVYILPADYASYVGKWDTVSCGTGPYRLVRSDSNTVTLVRFPDYWSKKPAYESVEYHYYSDSGALLSGLQSVPLQCAKLDGTPIPPEISGRYQIESIESLYVVYLGFNLSHSGSLMQSVDQRSALHQALDRQRIIDEARFGHATPSVQVVPPFVYGFDPSVKLSSFRKLTPKFPEHGEMHFLVRQLLAPVGASLQRQFQELGLHTRMTVLPDTEFFARLRSDDYDLYISRWGCVTTDASELFENCFYRKGAREGFGMTNYTHYGSAELDKEIEDSGLSDNPHERIKLMQKVMSRIAADLPWIPLYINHDVYAISQGILWQPRLDSRMNAAEFSPVGKR